MSTKRELNDYKERILESSFFLNHHSKVDNELILMFEVLNSKKYPLRHHDTENLNIYDNFQKEDAVSLSDANLIFLARLLDPSSLIYKLYWSSIAEAYHESVDLLKPLSIEESVSILKVLKEKDSKLFEVFKNHISINGFLKQSSVSNLINPMDLKINRYATAKGIIKIENDVLEKVIETDYKIIFDSIMLIQGISPRSGNGRDKIISDNNIPTKNDLKFLFDNDLVTDMGDYLKQEFGEDSENWKKKLEERYSKYFSKEKKVPVEQQIEQIKILTSGLENIIRKMNKLHSTFSEDQIYLHRNSLEEIFKEQAEQMLEKEDFYKQAKAAQSVWGFSDDESIVERDFYSAFATAPNTRNERDGGFYGVLVNALYYLLYCLSARMKLLLEISEPSTNSGIDVTLLSLLAGFSTDRTIKNELTRNDSILKRFGSQDRYAHLLHGEIDSKSALKWLRDDKRKLKFKEVVHSGNSERELNYKYLKNIYESFYSEYRNSQTVNISGLKEISHYPEIEFLKDYLKEPKTTRNLSKLSLVENSKSNADFMFENKDGSTTFLEVKKIQKIHKTREKILNALNRNKHKKTKSEQELLKIFYTDSETFKKI